MSKEFRVQVSESFQESGALISSPKSVGPSLQGHPQNGTQNYGNFHLRNMKLFEVAFVNFGGWIIETKAALHAIRSSISFEDSRAVSRADIGFYSGARAW